MALAPSIQAACDCWTLRPALTHRGRTLSYGELWQQIEALSGAYRALGIAPGDRVVCQLPTGAEHVVAAVAAWECGAIHVGAHRDLTGPELAGLVARTQAAAIVFEPAPSAADPLSALRAVQAAHPDTVAILHGSPPRAGEHALSELLRGQAPGPPPSVRGGETHDTDLLLLTSGTTGQPKAVMETLPGLWAKMRFFADAISPGPDDVHLMYLPICHAFGLKLSLMALAGGGRLVLQDRFSPAEALALVAEEGVTILPGTPTHIALLLRELDLRRDRIASLRWVVSAAAPLPPAVIEGVYDRLGAQLHYVYGSSEGFLTQTSDRDEIRAGSVGTRVFGAPDPAIAPDGSVAILDPERDVVLDAEQVGEIAFGTSRPVRYWREPAVIGETSWHRTGDLGRLDRRGRLFVSGRLKEVVNRGGLKVACGEVEAALAHHPGVSDCAVIPTPDPVLGEAICACVVVRGAGPPELAEVRAALAGRLARQKLPDELCVVESVPRSPVGKIDRAGLRALVVDGDLPRARQRPPVAATGG